MAGRRLTSDTSVVYGVSRTQPASVVAAVDAPVDVATLQTNLRSTIGAHGGVMSGSAHLVSLGPSQILELVASVAVDKTQAAVMATTGTTGAAQADAVAAALAEPSSLQASLYTVLQLPASSLETTMPTTTLSDWPPPTLPPPPSPLPPTEPAVGGGGGEESDGAAAGPAGPPPMIPADPRQATITNLEDLYTQLGLGTTVGAGVAILVCLCLPVLICCWCRRRKRRQQRAKRREPMFSSVDGGGDGAEGGDGGAARGRATRKSAVRIRKATRRDAKSEADEARPKGPRPSSGQWNDLFVGAAAGCSSEATIVDAYDARRSSTCVAMPMAPPGIGAYVAPPPPPTAPAEESAYGEWQPVVAEDGSTYYHNPWTGETSWDPPPAYGAVPTAAYGAASNTSTGGGSAAAPSAFV